jgi:DNA-binding response OmpR family regulator
MKQRRVLVVEDERTIAESVAARLRSEGFTVELAHDGPAAVAAARRFRPDLVVLDVMLPGFDGLEVCRRVQAERPVAVLMLTARDDETDLLVGLAVGADDYLTKPFSPRELAARVHALLRRIGRSDSDDGPIRLGDLEIDTAGRRVWQAGAPAHLTPTEFELLVRLARRPGAVVPRDQISGGRSVDSHVKALRRKLGADLIRTVHGVGYALEVRS